MKESVYTDVLNAIFDTSISIVATKTKTNYTVGETFTTNDITVSLVYKDGTSKAISGFTIEPATIDTSTPKVDRIVISYKIDEKILSTYIGITVTNEDMVLYELPEEKTFVSANKDYLDTGLCLLKIDTDFTLMIDFTGSADNTSNPDSHCLMHCMNEVDPYPGVSFAIWTVYYGFNLYDANSNKWIVSNKKNISYNDTDRHKLFLSKHKGSNTYTLRIDDCSGTITPTYFRQVEESLILGCMQETDGNRRRFWNGTIHQCKVWNRNLTESEITQLLENGQ